MPRIRTLWGWKCKNKDMKRWIRSAHSGYCPVNTRAEARKKAKVWESYLPDMKYVAVPLSELEKL